MAARALASAQATGSRIAIAIDLGGTSLRVALVDDAGRNLARVDAPTDARAGPERIITQIETLMTQLLASRPDLDPVGVGMSAPGPIDTVAGIASAVPTLAGFEGFPLRQTLQARLGRPVSLEGDGIAAAIGEWRFGAGRGFENLVYVTVSTGIGGGVIADGRVLRGRKGMAGHVGHMSVDPDGPLCPCGNRGCLEALGSGTALTTRARELAAGDAHTVLGRGGEVIDSRAIFAAGRQQDSTANAVIDEVANALGRGFVNLIHLYSPDVVVMGGGLSEEFGRLAPLIEARIASDALVAFRDVRLVRAALGQNSGLAGAAALAFGPASAG